MMYGRQCKTICQFKCKNNIYFHEIQKETFLWTQYILGISLIYILIHNFNILFMILKFI